MPTAQEISQTLDDLGLRRSAYLGIPQDVLEDLRTFCRAEATCFHQDPRMHAVLEGRREVWLRIQEHLNYTPEELLVLYSGGQYSVDLLKGTEYAR